MSNTNDELSHNYSPTCTIEDASMYLMGFCQSDIQQLWYESLQDKVDGEYFSRVSYQDIVEEWNAALLSLDEHQTAKNKITQKLAKFDDLINQNSDSKDKTIINKLNARKDLAVQIDMNLEQAFNIKQMELNDATNKYKQLYSYRTAIINELAKGTSSSLHVFNTSPTDIRNPYITLLTLKIWAKKSLKISILKYLDEYNPAKTIKKPYERGSAIVDAIKYLGHDPQKLPKNPSGKPGVRAKVRELIQRPPLFNNPNIFDKAWEWLSKNKKISYLK